MSRLNLTLLGAPAVRHGGQTVSFATRKSLALLAYLAVEGGPQSREKITALFWPDSPSAQGRGTLRRTLAYLHKSLGHEHNPHISAERDSLAFNPAEAELDLRLIQAALQGKHGSLAQLAGAAALCGGEFMDGFSLSDCPEFDHWASVQREVWHRKTGQVLERLSALQASAGQLPRAIETAARWVAHDALDEAAHRRLMTLHAASGDRAAALVAYAACRAVIARELGAEPSPQTQALARQVREQATLPAAQLLTPAPAASAPAPAAAPTTLPALPGEAPLLGRGREQAQLVSAFRLAREGRLQVVSIEGEPGIGKTRLAREFLAWVSTQGVTILHGRAFETGERLAYAPILEALRGRLETDDDPSQWLSDTWWAELSRLLPEIKERLPHLPAPAALVEAEARTRLFEAVARLGRAFAAEGPLVWFLDDLQWADASSLELLQYLTRRWAAPATSGVPAAAGAPPAAGAPATGGMPMVLLLTVRSEDLASNPALAAWLAGLGRDAALARVPLHNLGLEDLRQLVWVFGLGAPDAKTELPSGFAAFSQQLFVETAGHPLFIIETLRSLAERGLLRRNAAGEWEANLDREIPSGVKELIRGRVARLSPAARALSAAGAVLGDGADYAALRQVGELLEADALAGYEELLARGLLHEAGGHCFFTHDRIREVIYDDLSQARRGVLHARALAALQARGARPAALAHQALAAGQDGPAFQLSVAAGDEALQLFAVRDAIQHYQRAEQLFARGAAPAAADPQHLFSQLARAHELNTDWPAAGDTYQRMLAAARQLRQPAMEGSALNGLATLAAQNSDYPRAEELLHQARAVAEAGGDRLGWAESEWGLAQLGIYRIEPQAAYTHGTRALALARELGRPELTARALNVVAFAELALGQVAGVMAHGAEASERFAALGNRVLQADADKTVAHALMRAGRLAEGIALAQSALAISVELDNLWGQASCLLHIACALADQGELGAALETAARAAAAAVNVPYIPFLIQAAVGAMHRALFNLDQAAAIHQALYKEGVAHSLPAAALAMMAAERCADSVAAGQWDEAVVFARQASAQRGYGIMPSGHSLWPETMALARAGELKLAAADVAAYGTTLGQFRCGQVCYQRALGVLAEARGQPAEAEAHWRAALRLAEDIGLPGEQWPLYRLLGEDQQAEATLRWLAGRIGDDRLARQFLARAAGRT